MNCTFTRSKIGKGRGKETLSPQTVLINLIVLSEQVRGFLERKKKKILIGKKESKLGVEGTDNRGGPCLHLRPFWFSSGFKYTVTFCFLLSRN